MPPRDPIKTYIPQAQQKAPVQKEAARNQLPFLIRMFVWLLVFRSAVNLIFALIVGLAPDTAAASSIASNFDAWPRQMPPEAVFYISAFLYGLMAWRWYSRDWRARWVVMFLSGATAAKMMANYIADRAAGSPTPMTETEQGPFFVGVAINLAICAYLGFYPGMEQAFRETPWD